MQRSSTGYRGGIRAGHHYSHPRSVSREPGLNLSLSNSYSDDKEDGQRHSAQPSTAPRSEFESAIRNLRPSATHHRKSTVNANVSKQKADLPQLNAGENEQLQEHQHGQGANEEKHERRWFPNPQIGHVESDVFIRHNHVESTQKPNDSREHINPPALLTACPPAGVATRPTAVVAPAGLSRPTPDPFSSQSSMKKADDVDQSRLSKSISLPSHEQPQPVILSSSSAFQPLSALQNILRRQPTIKSAPLLMDIPQHKALVRGQQLKRVHISHPQSPSIVHLMLHEDFEAACRLLHDMAMHPDLQLDHAPIHPFKAQVHRLCACFHENRWFRCRIMQISADYSSATVLYLDWGMTIPTQIGPQYIRRLPNEFYAQPACAIMCRLDDVPDVGDTASDETVAACIALLSQDEYCLSVVEADISATANVVLSLNGENINERIALLLVPPPMLPAEDELMTQFRHELPLSVGEEAKVLLSSFSGKDDSFYVLLANENTVAVDRAMALLQAEHSSNNRTREKPGVQTLVAARFADDGQWYRAWIKSICVQRQQATVFFVDFGNESTVLFADIQPCPQSVRAVPWLGIRVRLADETMSREELAAFWHITQSNYIYIKIREVLADCYTIQVKVDYSIFLRHERTKSPTTRRAVDASAQTMGTERALSAICPSKSPDLRSTSVTPSITDQCYAGNETLLRNLFDMISSELRRFRSRINDTDEASQDRHSQLMQLLVSAFNLNNSHSSKRL